MKRKLIFSLIFVLLCSITHATNWTNGEIRVFYDGFEDYTISTLNGQGGWFGALDNVVISTPVYNGSRGAEVKSDGSAYRIIDTTIAEGLTNITYYVRGTVTFGGRLYTTVGDDNGNDIFLLTLDQDGYIDFQGAQLQTYTANTWYKIHFEINLDTSKIVNLYINDVLKANDTTYYESASNISRITFLTGGAVNLPKYFDNILIIREASEQPVTNSIIINSSTNQTNENIQVFCNVSDSDTDTLNYNNLIYKNDILIFNNSNTLNANESLNTNIINISSVNFVKNDNITVSCRGYDGDTYSNWTNSSQLTIIDSIPQPTSSINLYTTPIYLGQTINSNWAFNDADFNDSVDNDTSYFKWYNNGIINQQGQVNNEYLTFSNFSDDGDNITLSLLGNDGTTNASSWINSSTITIQDVLVTMTVNSLSTLDHTMSQNKSAEFILNIAQNQNTTLEYNISDNSNNSFISSITYNETTFNIINTSTKQITFTINTSDIVDIQTFNITLTRVDDTKLVTYQIKITVIANVAVLSITPTSTWSATMNSGSTTTRDYNISNTGRNATNCSFTATNGLNTFLQTNLTEGFNITEGETIPLTMSIVAPTTALYTGTITYTCQNATDTGAAVTVSQGVSYIILVQTPVTPTTGGGGGGAALTKDCDIIFNPDSLIFGRTNQVLQVQVINNENTAITPSYRLDNNLLSTFTIAVETPIIQPNTIGFVNLVYTGIGADSKTGSLTFNSIECNEEVINVTVSQTAAQEQTAFIQSFDDLKSFISEYFTSPLVTVFGFDITGWMVLLFTLLLGGLIGSLGVASVTIKIIRSIFIWLIFAVVLSFILSSI